MGPDPSERVILAVGIFAALLFAVAAAVVVSEWSRRRDRAADRIDRAADRAFLGGLADRIVAAIGAESKARAKAEQDRLYRHL